MCIRIRLLVRLTVLSNLHFDVSIIRWFDRWPAEPAYHIAIKFTVVVCNVFTAIRTINNSRTSCKTIDTNNPNGNVCMWICLCVSSVVLQRNASVFLCMRMCCVNCSCTHQRKTVFVYAQRGFSFLLLFVRTNTTAHGLYMYIRHCL